MKNKKKTTHNLYIKRHIEIFSFEIMTGCHSCHIYPSGITVKYKKQNSKINYELCKRI